MEKIFNVGDEIASDRCPTLIGKIITLPTNGADKGLAIVRVAEDKTLLVALSHWHRIQKESE
jgi:hypothetical protein